MSIDVHTHVYLPRYTELLRERKEMPCLRMVNEQERLFILPGKDEKIGGRPFGPNYHKIEEKLQGMKDNDIAVSVISNANPWLDFFSPAEAAANATVLNQDLEEICAASEGKLYGFGMIPLQSPREACVELERIAGHKHLRGIIIGTLGAGKGLDDPALDVIYDKLQQLQLTSFIHPHYGVDLGETSYGHVLPLALGFPFETTAAVTKMILSGTFEKYPTLRCLLAHSGGTLPFLAGRLDSCTIKDGTMSGKLPQKPSAYLSKLYYDALSYDVASIRAAIHLSSEDQLMFGTDFPFFGHDTTLIYDSLRDLNDSVTQKIRSSNAINLLNLALPEPKEGSK